MEENWSERSLRQRAMEQWHKGEIEQENLEMGGREIMYWIFEVEGQWEWQLMLFNNSALSFVCLFSPVLLLFDNNGFGQGLQSPLIETGDFSDFGQANIPKMSEHQVIENSLSDEKVWGNTTADTCKKVARCNDDTLDKCLTLDADEGERNGETEGLAEREVPLDGATSDLGRGPTCRDIKEADGLAFSSKNPKFRKEKNGLENLDRCNIQKPRPKEASILSHGPVCSKSSGKIAKTSIGLSTSSGSSVIRRKENGNKNKVRRKENGSENKVRGSHHLLRPKKTGYIKPTVKLGVGARQTSCGGMKRHKKKKPGNTNNNKAISLVVQRVD
ncbi:hypothetical protein Ancab_037470 [Ancistrocladus abbreviatus]